MVWVNNNRYQLGALKKHKDEQGEVFDKYGGPTPIDGFNEPVTQMAAGRFHSLFLTKSGKVYTLGSNAYGQAGVSNYLFPHVEEPTEVYTEGLNIKQIACGNHHNLVLDDEGRMYGFGSRVRGQIDGINDDGREEQ